MVDLTSPRDRIFEFDTVFVWQYSTAKEAEAWGDGEESEPVEIFCEFTIQDALRYVENRDRTDPPRDPGSKGER